MKRLLGLALLLAACAPTDVPAADEADVAAVEAQAAGDALLVQDLSQVRTPRLRISLLDVGQGDGILLQMPNGKNMVIDGGPSGDRFGDLLQARGIDSLDFMVLTHAHADHWGGLPDVMSLLPGDCGRRILDPGYDRTSVQGYQGFRDAAGCRYRKTGVGQTIPLDPSVQLSVINSNDSLQPSDQSHGVNNTSVVLRLQFRRFSMILGGDAESESEQQMWLDQGSALRSTVLKAGHHGSCTATARKYLQAVSPQYVVMSVGRNNNFGLPHCQTMGKLSAMRSKGLRWSRTDLNGPISIITDGYRYYVQRDHGAESQDDCPRDCDNPLEF